MLYNAKQLGSLLRQWASGNLDNITDDGHAIAGVDGCVVTHRGLVPQNLIERFTAEDVERVLALMLGAQSSKPYGLALVCHHYLGWTAERLGRVLGHRDVSTTHSLLMLAENVFAGLLLNGQTKNH